MAIYDSGISVLITTELREKIRVILADDQGGGRVSEADVVRAALALGLPILARKSQRERLRLYAAPHTTV
jgi:hypothetical protein